MFPPETLGAFVPPHRVSPLEGGELGLHTLTQEGREDISSQALLIQPPCAGSLSRGPQTLLHCADQEKQKAPEARGGAYKVVQEQSDWELMAIPWHRLSAAPCRSSMQIYRINE